MTLKILSSVLVLGSLRGQPHNMAYFGIKSYLDNIWQDCLLSELAAPACSSFCFWLCISPSL